MESFGAKLNRPLSPLRFHLYTCPPPGLRPKILSFRFISSLFYPSRCNLLGGRTLHRVEVVNWRSGRRQRYIPVYGLDAGDQYLVNPYLASTSSIRI